MSLPGPSRTIVVEPLQLSDAAPPPRERPEQQPHPSPPRFEDADAEPAAATGRT